MTRKIDVSRTTNAFKSKIHDPNGSYTGMTSDGGAPIQDADDL